MKYRLLKDWGVYKAGDVIKGAYYDGCPNDAIGPGIPGMVGVNPFVYPGWFEKIVDEPESWKPGEGYEYWFLDDRDFFPQVSKYKGDDYDNERVSAGNYFRSFRDARVAGDKIKDLLKSLKQV